MDVTYLGRGDTSHFELLGKPPAKGEIESSAFTSLWRGVVLWEFDGRCVDQEEVGSLGLVVLEADLVKVGTQDVSSLGVGFKLVWEKVVLFVRLETDGDGFLHWGIGAEYDSGVCGDGRRREFRRADEPS